MLWRVSLTDPVLLVPVPTQRIVSTGYTVTSTSAIVTHGTYKKNTQLTVVAVSKTQNLALSERKPLVLSLPFYPEWA